MNAIAPASDGLNHRQAWAIFAGLVIVAALVGLFVHGPTEPVSEKWARQWLPHLDDAAMRQLQQGIGDEWVHLTQIERFRKGNWTLDPGLELPMLPGYHAVMAVASNAVGIDSVFGYRVLSTLLYLPAPFLFFAMLAGLTPTQRLIRGAQFLLLPAMFPYVYLTYTDGFSLTLLLLTVFLVERNILWAAGFVGFASLLVRQNNVVFLAMLQAMVYLRENGWMVTPERLLKNIAKCWSIVLAGLGFVIWVMVQGALSGDARVHAGGFFTDNTFSFLFLAAIALLPLHAANFIDLRRRLTERTTLIIALAVVLIGLALFIFTFRADNPFQGAMQHMLVNRVAMSAARSPLYGTIFVALALAAALSFTFMRWRQRWHWGVLPAIFLFLTPLWLIHARYALACLALIMLWRAPAPRWAEYGTIATLLIITIVAIATGWS